MRRLRPLLPFGILLGLALLAVGPLAAPTLTCSDDGAFHLYRAVQLGALLEAGHFFPRWAPHMAQGYGFPFFNFYAPLSSYAVVGLHWLGLEYPAALKLAFALAIWGAGCAAYVLARRRWGERAGLAAGAAYLFAPYLAYDALFRGNLAETTAFVWPPLVLWGLHYAADRSWSGASQRPGRAWLLPAVFYAALILTHNIFALIVSPLLAAYGLLLAWQRRSTLVLFRSGLALLLGIGLTAYFWLPALAERGLVHSERLLVAPIFTWYTNFITPAELLAPPRVEDPLLLNPSPPRTLGLVPVLLGLPALALALWAARRRRAEFAHALALARQGRWSFLRGPSPYDPEHSPLSTGLRELGLFAVALLGYSLMTLPVSEPVWRLLPPLELVQFPWRLLGPAALCAAVLAGASVAALERRLPRPAAYAPAAVFIVTLVAANLSWWYPRACSTQATASLADLLAYERGSGTLGTTAKGEYLPLTVEQFPADETLADALLRGEEPARLLVASGDADFAVVDARDPLDATFTVTANTAAALVYRQFLYPGWIVTVDGTAVALQPTPGTGLIAFALTPGQHTVHVTFGTTPLRNAASGLSLVSLALAAGAFLWRRRPPSAARAALTLELGPWDLALDPRPLTLGLWDLALLAGLLAVLKPAVIDQFPNPLRRSAFDGAVLTTAQMPQRVDFTGGLSLLGYDVETRALPADGGLDVAVYVAMRAPALRTFWPAFRIEDAQGRSWNDLDAALPPRWHREPPLTYTWPPEHYAQWARRLTLLPGTPPGEYALFLSVFDRSTFETLSVLDDQERAIAPRLALGTLVVTGPAQTGGAALQPENPASASFGPLTLLGYDLQPDRAQAGDTLALTWYWRAEAAPARADTAQLSLLDAAGQAAYSVAWAPVDGFSTELWQPGDQWRGQHRLTLPADLPGGRYALQVTVPGRPGVGALGTLDVEAPHRTYTPPPFQTGSGAQFAEVAALTGFTLTRAERSLSLTLVWQAAATPAQRYSVFVHLGQADRVWAQSDSVPAQGARPTTGWLAGEYVTDVHTLTLPDDLPPGEYALLVGLYDPQTGARVPASGPGAGFDGRTQIAVVAVP